MGGDKLVLNMIFFVFIGGLNRILVIAVKQAIRYRESTCPYRVRRGADSVPSGGGEGIFS